MGVRPNMFVMNHTPVSPFSRYRLIIKEPSSTESVAIFPSSTDHICTLVGEEDSSPSRRAP